VLTLDSCAEELDKRVLGALVQLPKGEEMRTELRKFRAVIRVTEVVLFFEFT